MKERSNLKAWGLAGLMLVAPALNSGCTTTQSRYDPITHDYQGEETKLSGGKFVEGMGAATGNPLFVALGGAMQADEERKEKEKNLSMMNSQLRSLRTQINHLTMQNRGETSEPEHADFIRIRVSASEGVAPFLVSHAVAVPANQNRGAFYTWSYNGEFLSNGLAGQARLNTPGTHKLEVIMTTEEGKEYTSSEDITVLERSK